jgi:hypothetical protein
LASSRRRSLTNVGGDVETSGDPRAAEILRHAADVTPSVAEGADDRQHVHGFHAYPARAHPVTVRRLIEGLVPEGGIVLDPFCGSGTVLVEAMLAGRTAVGTDLNPFAVMLARAKTFPRTRERTGALVAAARAAAEVADARRKAKAGAARRFQREDVEAFAPHVLLELDGIRLGIAAAPPELRPELSLVLSSILVKVSTRRGDTSEGQVDKRIAAGYPARLFVKKAEELARRFDAFYDLVTHDGERAPPRARVFEDDATVLKKLEAGSVDAVITSPPYVATYDYLAHHELRLRWLGLDTEKLRAGELGARRHYARLSPREALAAWEKELDRLLASLARVMKRGAPLVLLIADSATGSARRRVAEESANLANADRVGAIRADDVVARVAGRRRDLVPVARASQPRQHFHTDTALAFAAAPRFEHLLLLRRS